MDEARIRALRRIAGRHARVGHEADDLVQEALLAAVAAGRHDLETAENRRWVAGAIARRAAFDARTAGRRRRREAAWRPPADAAPDRPDLPGDLPPSLAVLLALILSGHSRREVAWLLGINDAALRQRVTALRKRLQGRGAPEEFSGLTLDLACGRLRLALVPLLRHGGDFATHDPDGHLFVVRRSGAHETDGRGN